MGAALRPNGLENGGFVRGGRRLPVLSQPTARRVFGPDYKDDDEGEPGDAGGGSRTAPGFYRTGLGNHPGAMKSKEKRSVAVTTDTQLIHCYRCLQDEVIEMR